MLTAAIMDIDNKKKKLFTDTNRSIKQLREVSKKLIRTKTDIIINKKLSEYKSKNNAFLFENLGRGCSNLF